MQYVYIRYGNIYFIESRVTSRHMMESKWHAIVSVDVGIFLFFILSVTVEPNQGWLALPVLKWSFQVMFLAGNFHYVQHCTFFYIQNAHITIFLNIRVF